MRSETRRTRLVIVVSAVVLAISAANWVGIAVHVSNLRSSAARELRSGSSVDDALERRAHADDFDSARIAFEVLTLVSAAALIGTVALRRIAR